MVMATLSLSHTLTQLEIFKGFTSDEVQRVLHLSEMRSLAPGEVLIHPGHPNHILFLLMEGEMQIVLEKDGTTFTFPILPGECVGEMSLLMERPTSAMAVTLTASRVLCVPETIFWDHIMHTRRGTRNMMSLMAARLQRTNHALIKGVEEQLKYKHLEKELETAGKIQANIVPDGKRLFPNHAAVDAYALIDQAREVGGDFYDALALDDHHVYLSIGDVSGKGMPAALFMVRAFTFLRLLISNNPGFEDVIPALNQWLAKKNEDMMFISIFAGVLDLRTGVLRYVNAGHNPPFASISGAPYQLLGFSKAPLVGIMDQAQFAIHEMRLEPGDALFLYTDGVSESTNANEDMFETERMEAALNRGPYLSMEAMVKALQHDVEQFVADAPQHDDFTAFALRYVG